MNATIAGGLSARLGPRTGLTASIISSGDPLAGIPLVLRLQSHNFQPASSGTLASIQAINPSATAAYAPFGLFQDAACTVPAVNWGDPIGGWKDMFTAGNPVASQSNAMERPLLKFSSNGDPWFPYLDFLGTSSLTGSSLNPTAYFCSFSVTDLGFSRIVSQDSGNNGIYANGTTLVAGFNPTANIATISENIWTEADASQGSPAFTGFNGVETAQPAAAFSGNPATFTIGDYTSGGGQSLIGGASSLIIPSVITLAQRQKIRNYITSLTA